MAFDGQLKPTRRGGVNDLSERRDSVSLVGVQTVRTIFTPAFFLIQTRYPDTEPVLMQV